MPADARQASDAAMAAAEAELERARAEVVAKVGALQQEVADTLDWRRWCRRHPGVLVVSALGVGYLLGRRLRGTR